MTSSPYEEPVSEGTDHSSDIQVLRAMADLNDAKANHLGNGRNSLATSLRHDAQNMRVAADLLEVHDRTGISLDNWLACRLFVEREIGHPITENGV